MRRYAAMKALVKAPHGGIASAGSWTQRASECLLQPDGLLIASGARLEVAQPGRYQPTRNNDDDNADR
jgi:hypothetical protein